MAENASNITIETKLGTFTLDGGRDSSMVAFLRNKSRPHLELLTVAKAYVSRGVAIDVGAHVGTVSVPLARIADKVIAFEANPDALEYLKRNIAQNKVVVDVRGVGLSDRPGRASVATVHVRNAGANTLAAGDDVIVSILDEEVSVADFIKIDVEGMELRVLRGGAQLISRSRPAIWFEVNLKQLRAHGTSTRDLHAWFKECGYTLYIPIVHNTTLTLGRVASVSLVTFLITPRAWLFGGHCMPFDVLALPREKEVRFSTSSFFLVLRYFIWRHVMQKLGRVVLWFSWRRN